MPQPRHVRLTDLELAELRALEGAAAVAAKNLDSAREYAQHRLRVALQHHGVEITPQSSWQLDSETGLVVETATQPSEQQS